MTACLARSSSPLGTTTHSRATGDFPVARKKRRIGGRSEPVFCLCKAVTGTRSLFRCFCLWRRNPVSRQQRFGSRETGSTTGFDSPSNPKQASNAIGAGTRYSVAVDRRPYSWFDLGSADHLAPLLRSKFHLVRELGRSIADRYEAKHR